jgi:hypothetical protein
MPMSSLQIGIPTTMINDCNFYYEKTISLDNDLSFLPISGLSSDLVYTIERNTALF